MEHEIYEILNRFKNNGFEAFIVGGYVRDKYLGIKSYDIDICTSAKMEDVKKLFPNIKYNDFLCGNFKLNNYNIEITTYRREFCYDGRKPLKISYASSLKEDLSRRDFTINTICLDGSGNYIDLLDGITDLDNKIIRSVGNSDIKIKEDNLRILRAIRFASNLNFKLDNNLENSIMKYSKKVRDLSSYRKRYELDRIFNNKNFNYGINLLKKFNIDKYLNIKFQNNINYSDNVIGMYAQMDICDNAFFTKEEIKQLNILKKYKDKDLSNFDLYNIGYDNLVILEQITNKKFIDSYEKLPIKNSNELNLIYNNVIKLNKKTSFDIIKEEIIKQILNNNLPNNKENIENYIIINIK